MRSGSVKYPGAVGAVTSAEASALLERLVEDFKGLLLELGPSCGPGASAEAIATAMRTGRPRFRLTLEVEPMTLKVEAIDGRGVHFLFAHGGKIAGRG